MFILLLLFLLPWNLDRVDQRSWPLDDVFQPPATGRGVTVYVVDSGIQLDHPEFEGRAVKGFGKPNVDGCNGHGTHVAGIIGSRSYGVAKDVRLVSVRVLPCSGLGSMSELIDGLKWIKRQGRRSRETAVVNISLAGSVYGPLETAIAELIEQGFVIVVSAGNSNNGGRDACELTPARIPDVITVAATDGRDYRDPNSNYGPCVDIFAPGVSIVSTWTDSRTFNMGGTSTAAPHVSGAAALYLETHPYATVQEVTDWLMWNATLGAITDARSVNRFVYAGM